MQTKKQHKKNIKIPRIYETFPYQMIPTIIKNMIYFFDYDKLEDFLAEFSQISNDSVQRRFVLTDEDMDCLEQVKSKRKLTMQQIICIGIIDYQKKFPGDLSVYFES